MFGSRESAGATMGRAVSPAMTRARLATASLLLAGTMMGTAPALAQDGASTPPPAPQSPPSIGITETAAGPLEVITVTARKRNENILQTPITLTALTSETMEVKGIEDRRDLNRFTPGFKAAPQNTSSASRLINSYEMRGLGTVNLFWNGVPVNGGDIPEMLDLQRVEVLKGPQNAYFGRSTFSGAINFIPKIADFHTEGYVEGDLGTYANRDAKAGLQGTLVDGLLAGRVAVGYHHTGGQYDNFGYGGTVGTQETAGGSASLLVTPSDTLKIKLYGAYWEEHDGPNAIAFLQPSDYNCNGGNAPAGTNNYYCGAIKSAPANRISQLTNYPDAVFKNLADTVSEYTVGSGFIKKKNGLHRQGIMTQASFDQELPWNFTLSGLGAYNQNKAAQIFDYGSQFYTNPATYNPSATGYLFKDKYGEIRLTSDGHKRLRGMVGTSYVDSSQIIQSVLNRSGVPSVSFPPTNLYSTTFGVFGSLSWDIIKQITITAEGRWQNDKVGRSTLTNGSWVDLHGSTKSFVPRIIAQYHARPNLEFFVSYSEGSSPGSLNTGFLSLPAYAQAQVAAQYAVPSVIPEQKLRNYEAGIKGTFFDGKLRVLGSIYTAKWTKQPNSAALFYTTPAGVLTQANVQLGSGSTKGRGTEWEITVAPVAGLVLDGTFAYNHTNVLYTVCAACQQITGNINPTGISTARFPEITAGLGATYRHHLFGDYDGIFHIDANYQGKEYADLTNLVWLEPYWMSNMRIGIENHKYKVELYVQNLFNNKTPQAIAQTTDQITGKNVITITPAQKPVVGVRAGFNF